MQMGMKKTDTFVGMESKQYLDIYNYFENLRKQTDLFKRRKKKPTKPNRKSQKFTKKNQENCYSPRKKYSDYKGC
jgi:hypothetical protein